MSTNINSNNKLVSPSVLSYFSYLIKKIDIYGNTFTFEEDSKQSYRTLIGGVLTILLMILVIVMGFIFGQEIYLHDVPTVSNSGETLSYSKINMKSLPIIFSIESNEELIYDYTQYFTIKTSFVSRKSISFQQYDEDDSSSRLLDDTSSSSISSTNSTNTTNSTVNMSFDYLEQCTSEMFEELSDDQYNVVLQYLISTKNTFCYPPSKISNSYFQNELYMDNSTVILTKLIKCDQFSSNKCVDNLTDLIPNMNVRIVYLNSYTDPKNYNQPIYYFMETHFLLLSNYLSKKVYLTFSQNQFKSDNGWILTNTQITDYISLENKFLDVDSIESFANSNEIYLIYIQSPKMRNIVNRSFIKVQEIFAKIGGLFNGMNLCLQILMYHYVRFKYMNSIFDVVMLTEERKCKVKGNDRGYNNNNYNDFNLKGRLYGYNYENKYDNVNYNKGMTSVSKGMLFNFNSNIHKCDNSPIIKDNFSSINFFNNSNDKHSGYYASQFSQAKNRSNSHCCNINNPCSSSNNNNLELKHIRTFTKNANNPYSNNIKHLLEPNNKEINNIELVNIREEQESYNNSNTFNNNNNYDCNHKLLNISKFKSSNIEHQNKDDDVNKELVINNKISSPYHQNTNNLEVRDKENIIQNIKNNNKSNHLNNSNVNSNSKILLMNRNKNDEIFNINNHNDSSNTNINNKLIAANDDAIDKSENYNDNIGNREASSLKDNIQLPDHARVNQNNKENKKSELENIINFQDNSNIPKKLILFNKGNQLILYPENPKDIALNKNKHINDFNKNMNSNSIIELKDGLQSIKSLPDDCNNGYLFYLNLLAELKSYKLKSYRNYLVNFFCCCKKYNSLRTYYNFLENKIIDKISFYKYIEVINN